MATNNTRTSRTCICISACVLPQLAVGPQLGNHTPTCGLLLLAFGPQRAAASEHIVGRRKLALGHNHRPRGCAGGRCWPSDNNWLTALPRRLLACSWRPSGRKTLATLPRVMVGCGQIQISKLSIYMANGNTDYNLIIKRKT